MQKIRYAFNANKKDGTDYKEATLKTVWNTTAKLVQQLHFKNFDRKINPFSDIEFKNAREARDSKRKTLQAIPKKRRVSAAAIEEDNYNNMINTWDENTPSGLQKKKNIFNSG